MVISAEQLYKHRCVCVCVCLILSDRTKIHFFSKIIGFSIVYFPIFQFWITKNTGLKIGKIHLRAIYMCIYETSLYKENKYHIKINYIYFKNLVNEYPVVLHYVTFSVEIDTNLCYHDVGLLTWMFIFSSTFKKILA